MSAPREDRNHVQSLERGLLVIGALGAPGAGRTLADVARQTGLTRASARRFLLTLEQLGYVRSHGRLFALTPRVLELGRAYLTNLGITDIAHPHLRALVEQVGESSSMSVLDGDEVVYVARVPTQARIMTVAISVGTRLPAAYTSMGRVLLAALEPQARPDLPEDVARAVDRAREQGWALVDQELEQGLRSIAVPLRRPDGSTVAAVNLSTHAARRSISDIRRELLPALRATADAVERQLAAM